MPRSCPKPRPCTLARRLRRQRRADLGEARASALAWRGSLRLSIGYVGTADRVRTGRLKSTKTCGAPRRWVIARPVIRLLGRIQKPLPARAGTRPVNHRACLYSALSAGGGQFLQVSRVRPSLAERHLTVKIEFHNYPTTSPKSTPSRPNSTQ